MKTIIILAALMLASCTKQAADVPAQDAPMIMNCKWYEVRAGGNPSVAFDLTVYIPSGSVAKLQLINDNVGGATRAEIVNPKSGSYTIYDHVAFDYPLYNDFVFYHFRWLMADGTVINGDKFQVY